MKIIYKYMSEVRSNWKVIIAGITLFLLVIGNTAYVSGRFSRVETKVEINTEQINKKGDKDIQDLIFKSLDEIKSTVNKIDGKLDKHLIQHNKQ